LQIKNSLNIESFNYYIFFLKNEGTSKSFLLATGEDAGILLLVLGEEITLESFTGFLPNGFEILALVLSVSL
jgi:hypothetical protein